MEGSGTPAPVVNVNDAVAFVVEIVAFGLLAAWGFQAVDSTVGRLALGVGIPLVAAVAWGLWAAPRARFQQRAVAVVVKVVVLGAGVAAGFAVLPLAGAIAFAVLASANTTLTYVGPFAR